tara:strand:+ start:1029 stop:1592 length:564 start_codon:yes stop_codon:yes gene_type:complete
MLFLEERYEKVQFTVQCGKCDTLFISDMWQKKYCPQEKTLTKGSQYIQTLVSVSVPTFGVLTVQEAFHEGLRLWSVRSPRSYPTQHHSVAVPVTQSVVLETRYKEKKQGNGFKPRTTDIDLRKVKAHQAKKDEFDFRCPEPQKKTYRTEDEAKTFISEHHPDDPYIRPYKCRCGAIHIGHSYSRSYL